MGLAPHHYAADLPTVAQSLPLKSGQATFVDLSGAEAKAGQRMVAAMVSQGDSTWFYKLTGSAAAVATEKARFLAMVQNVR